MFEINSVIKNYKILADLKKGAQGFVYLVEEAETAKRFVLKILFPEERKKKDFEDLIKIWKEFCGSKAKDFIVSFKEYFYEDRKIMIIMEYCSGGDLETLIKKRILEEAKFSEEEVMKVLIEGMSGLKEMHSRNFIHRDIKSANILITADGGYKLADFNTSKIFEGSVGAPSLVGTLEYTAPEMVNSEQYSFPVDVFSLGIVLYQMMVGKTPFVNEQGVVIKDLMLGKYESISSTHGYSQHLTDFVHACLSLNPSQRPTAAEALDMAFVVRMRKQFAVRAETRQMVAAVEARMEERIHALMEKVRMSDERARMAEEKVSVLAERVRVSEEKAVGFERELAKVKAEQQQRQQQQHQQQQQKDEFSQVSAPKGIEAELNLTLGFLKSHSILEIECLGNKVVWKKKGWRTVFVDQERMMDNGVFKINIGYNEKFGSSEFGCAADEVLRKVSNNTLTYCVGTCGIDCKEINCGPSPVCKRSFFPSLSNNGPHLALELDADQHVLYFFVNGVQVPHCIVGVPSAVHFGVSGHDEGFSVELKSFTKLTKPSVNQSLSCSKYPWK